MEQAKEIRYGCRFGGDEMVVVRVSRELAGNVRLARRILEALDRENAVRAYHGEPLVPYKITTSEKLADQFPDVAAGDFKLEDLPGVDQQVSIGRYFFASGTPEVGREK